MFRTDADQGGRRKAEGARVIRGRRVEHDVWQAIGLDPAEDLAVLPAGPIIVALELWKQRRDELSIRKDPIGIWLSPEDDPAELAEELYRLPPAAHRLGCIAIHFPKFGDGRGYSTGALLRTRYGWRGELRAFGDIGRDHLLALARCGFDAFRLPPQRDPVDALKAFDDFSFAYQGCVDDPVPLFRKRAAAAPNTP